VTDPDAVGRELVHGHRGRSDAVPAGVPPVRDFLARRFAAASPPLSWALFERLGGALAYVFARVRTPPAVPTVLGGAAGVFGALVLGSASGSGDQLMALALLLLSYTFDCTDGQLARATNTTSDRGAWLDVAMDSVVIAFVSAALCSALLTAHHTPMVSALLAGGYGASRTVSLFTSTRVRQGNGGMRLVGARSVLRSLYVAAIDTPVTYIVLCAFLLAPSVFVTVIAVLTILTTVQALVSAEHHFRVPGRERERRVAGGPAECPAPSR
jgi:phosphatidylglycerophosphate synthase